ncbi:hypothetical protein IAD21_02402 [Abditibacteriota bacterium]|nr:hypothetical protein IAD21_02402 [Abditibacteriota bacterium]
MFSPPPQAFAEAFWRGHQRRLALALHDNYIYFWEPDSAQFQQEPQEWMFAVDYQLGFSDEGQITPQLLASELEWALANNRVGRRFQLANTLTVFLRKDVPESLVIFRLGGIEKVAPFGLDWDYNKTFDWSQSYCIERLEMEALEGVTMNECGFASAMAESDIPFFADAPAKICLLHGTEEEMKQIADIIFQLAPKWIEELLSRPHFEGEVQIQFILSLNKPVRYIAGGHDCEEGSIPLAHPGAELWDVCLEYFDPRLDTNLHRENIDAGDRLFSFAFRPWAYLKRRQAERGRPAELSQHEQLELILELRDWLRERVGLSDERIAELLTPST